MGSLKQANGKSYGTNSEEEYRMKVYNDNYNIVAAHNAGDETFKLKLNKFADLTNVEFAAQYTGYNKPTGFKANKTVIFNTSNLKSSVNWVTENKVAAVKDQGHCGSCWAFSTVCAVESANAIKNNSSVTPLSEQQLVDCAGGTWGNHGCSGGLMDFGFQYVESNPLATEDDYPYRGTVGTCRATSFTGVGKVSTFTDVRQGDPDQLRAAISQGVVSVAIEADQSVFQLYDYGVITSSSCGTHLDHGVAAVGYGSENGEDYFLVRNSWGSSWGDHGYVKIGASSSNICGILSSASYPSA